MENPLAADLDHVLARTDDRVWQALRGQRIFITGGTGFFGRWLLESFAWANRALDLRASVVVLSRDPAANLQRAPHLGPEAGISWVRGDVRSITLADVQSQLGESSTPSFPFLIHAATESASTQARDAPLEMFDTCVQGTRNMLELAVAGRGRRFLFTSSGAVYGPQPPGITHIPEDYRGGPDPLAVSSAYSEGKRGAEHLCAQWHQIHPTLEPVIARCFAFVGPFLPLDAHFAAGNFVGDALAGRPIRVGGDGTAVRSYLYAADLAIWLWTILIRAEPLRAVNVGSGDSVTIAQLAVRAARLREQALPIEIARAPVVGAIPQRYVPNVERAESDLGLIASLSLEDSLRRTLDWHLGMRCN